MAGGTIRGTVTATVTLGEGGYHHRLKITAKGLVQPSAYGAAAIIDPANVHHGEITNYGTIAGAYGGSTGGTVGGVGIVFAAAGTLVNAGIIEGGNGGYGSPSGLAGGAGVDLNAGGDIMNSGSIRGGQGGYGSANTGPGGLGVAMNGGTLTNTGVVTGGAAKIAGGKSGASNTGGMGVYATGGASVINSATLAGGAGAYSYGFGSAGGNGVELNAATLNNIGGIIGGLGGAAYDFYGGTGGAGLVMSGGAAAVNDGTITGGHGGYCGRGIGGTGGAGVDLQSGTLTNAGTITGGAGGYYRNGGQGHGGTGVTVIGGTLIAGATIAGGFGNLGGAGVTLSGGEVIAGGTISAGAGSERNGDAVRFGSVTGTLAIDPGAAFDGLVAANAAAADVLILSGSIAGTLTGLGSQFIHFATVETASGADWALEGSNTLSAQETLQDAGTLSVTGTLVDAGSARVAAGGVLGPGTSGSILLAGITLAGGRLIETAGGTLVAGSSLAGAAAGTLLIQAGAAVTGEGTINADALSIAGALAAQGGTLTLDEAVTGTGTATIATAATLVAEGTLSVARVDFAGGGGTLCLGVPAEVTTTLAGFGTDDIVDLRKLKATALTYAGGTLTLLDGSTIVDTLRFAGSYAAANFALTPDDRGGTDVLYVAVQAFSAGDLVAAPNPLTCYGADRADYVPGLRWARPEDTRGPVLAPAHGVAW